MQGSSRGRRWAYGTRSYRVERSKRALQLLVVLAFLLVMFGAMLYDVWHVAGGAGAVLLVPVVIILVVFLAVFFLVIWRGALPAPPAPLPEIEVPEWMTLHCSRCGTVTWWDGNILGEMNCTKCGTPLTWDLSRDRR